MRGAESALAEARGRAGAAADVLRDRTLELRAFGVSGSTVSEVRASAKVVLGELEAEEARLRAEVEAALADADRLLPGGGGSA